MHMHSDLDYQTAAMQGSLSIPYHTVALVSDPVCHYLLLAYHTTSQECDSFLNYCIALHFLQPSGLISQNLLFFLETCMHVSTH